jgi:hypothetical protein
MKDFKNCGGEPVGSPSLRPSFREAISRAEGQVEFRCYKGGGLEKLAHELCCIMAEIYMMDPSGKVRISGEWLDTYVVQEVFGEITNSHLELVISDFSRLCIDIQNKKAYLRTMLYNSVFTLEADSVNDCAKIDAELRGAKFMANLKGAKT